ncbi:hypothetical protein ALP66_200005 [Pseudomonas amygdali pv. photiniae]|uniref:Uncharacterized protein n=1 Tax=Pseudomonas amygdali pv. photiniae TaxID=251724 RepID=A0A658KE05_PSEA0|nr:hypothetical protein ALP66_200005 [Pseudomonas amygdali pv. photiniae]
MSRHLAQSALLFPAFLLDLQPILFQDAVHPTEVACQHVDLCPDYGSQTHQSRSSR